MQEYKNRVEAILFTTGRFMDMEELSRLTGIASSGMLKDIVQELKQDYETKEGSLTILEENGRYKLNIRKQYNYLTTKLLSDCELDKPTQETLAIIAYKNPALQSDIIKVRGTTAYDHIKFLKENDFIASERHGRTRLLKLAPKFFDYFDIVEESLKAQLEEIGAQFQTEQQETLQQEDGRQSSLEEDEEETSPNSVPEDDSQEDQEPEDSNPENENTD